MPTMRGIVGAQTAQMMNGAAPMNAYQASSSPPLKKVGTLKLYQMSKVKRTRVNTAQRMPGSSHQNQIMPVSSSTARDTTFERVCVL